MAYPSAESSTEQALPVHRHYGLGFALSSVRRALIKGDPERETTVQLPLFRRDRSLWIPRGDESHETDSRFKCVPAAIRPVAVAPAPPMINLGVEVALDGDSFTSLYLPSQHRTEQLGAPCDRLYVWFGALSAAATVIAKGDGLESQMPLSRDATRTLAHSEIIASALT